MHPDEFISTPNIYNKSYLFWGVNVTAWTWEAVRHAPSSVIPAVQSSVFINHAATTDRSIGGSPLQGGAAAPANQQKLFWTPCPVASGRPVAALHGRVPVAVCCLLSQNTSSFPSFHGLRFFSWAAMPWRIGGLPNFGVTMPIPFVTNSHISVVMCWFLVHGKILIPSTPKNTMVYLWYNFKKRSTILREIFRQHMYFCGGFKNILVIATTEVLKCWFVAEPQLAFGNEWLITQSWAVSILQWLYTRVVGGQAKLERELSGKKLLNYQSTLFAHSTIAKCWGSLLLNSPRLH